MGGAKSERRASASAARAGTPLHGAGGGDHIASLALRVTGLCPNTISPSALPSRGHTHDSVIAIEIAAAVAVVFTIYVVFRARHAPAPPPPRT